MEPQPPDVPNAVSNPWPSAVSSPAPIPVTRPDSRSSPLARFLAKLLDDAVTIPGTKIGVGLDSVIGLVPGVGDVIGSSLSTVILVDAVRLRVPIPVLLKMAGNLLLDAVLGLVPFVGDLADVAHRANRKNLRLLEATLAAKPPPTSGLTYLLSAGLIVFAALFVVIGSALFAIWLLTRLFS